MLVRCPHPRPPSQALLRLLPATHINRRAGRVAIRIYGLDQVRQPWIGPNADTIHMTSGFIGLAKRARTALLFHHLTLSCSAVFPLNWP